MAMHPFFMKGESMDLDEYQVGTRRTRTPQPTKRADFLHCNIGFKGEVGELLEIIKKDQFFGIPFDRDRVVKEAGDVLWYFASLLDLFDMTLNRVAKLDYDIDLVDREDPYAIAEVADDLGRKAAKVCPEPYPYYETNGFGLDRVTSALFFQYFKLLLGLLGITLEEVMEKNVEKLRIRYPEKWTAEDAASRKDEQQ